MRREYATVRDVAKLAGVSTMTVSRAMNAEYQGYLRPATREKILEIAKKLNYRPDPHARSLLLKRAFNVGFCINHPRFNYYQLEYQPMLTALQEKLDAGGYRLGYYYFQTDKDSQFERFIKDSRVVDGIVVLGRNMSEWECDLVREYKVRAVSLFQEIPGFHSIIVDEYNAGREAADILWGYGHRMVTLVMPAGREMFPKEWNGRINGFLERAGELGMKVYPLKNHWNAAYQSEFAWNHGQLAPDFLKKLSKAEAAGKCLYVISDIYAFGIISMMDAAGLVLGKDISILGFDNLEGIGGAPWKEPRLATFDRARNTIGEKAAKLVTSSLPPATTTIPMQFVERPSIARVK